MNQRTITLAPDEIVVNGRKHTLVPGYQEWSTYRNGSSPHFLSLYYKQTYITTLREYAGGKGYAERYGNKKSRYADLASAIETLKDDWGVRWTEQENAKRGIVQWCQRGETVATVTVTLSGEEIDWLEREAKTHGSDVETFTTQAIKTLLHEGHCLL
jgi:hypothetical protein